MESAEGQRFNRASGLVLCVSVLLVADAIASGVAVSSSLMEIQLLQAFADGYEVSEAQADASDFRQMVIGLVQIGIFLPLSVLFLRYLWRANHNARALVGEQLEYTAGSCVWWFFVPFANLYKPFRAVKEIWNASNPSYDPESGTGGSTLLHIWWGLWILAGISWHFNFGDDNVQQMIMGSWVMIASDILGVFLAVAALGVIREIYRMQNVKADALFGSSFDGTQASLSDDVGLRQQVV